MPTIHLKKGRDASLRRHHPWVFSGAIADVRGKPGFGDTVQVLDSRGEYLGVGAYSPESQIRVRMFDFCEKTIDANFFAEALQQAIKKRLHLYRDCFSQDSDRNAYRLVFGESDGLPGLVVDQYGDFLVCQFMFAGVERWKAVIVEELVKLTSCLGIFERSDVSTREKEGLGLASGLLWGKEPPAELIISEYGSRFAVDIIGGQKTGFYLDQADNRRKVGSLCKNKSVLNCFAYSGGFSVAALKAGADHVTSVDSSGPALALATANVARNDIDARRHACVEANVFHWLRESQLEGLRFDLIILDPPKFADTKTQVQKAARAYKDLALQAAKVLEPGGLLVNFSCSGGMDLNLFQKITADALLDAGRTGQILYYLHQAPDHPISLAFPESQYLKGLVCQVD